MVAITNPAARTGRRGLQAAACAAVALVSVCVVCAASAGPVRQLAGLGLIGVFALAVWFMHRTRFEAIVPAIGLTLAFLILAGLALAAVHALSTVPVAIVFGLATLAAAWIGASRPPAARPAEPGAWLKPPYPLAVIGVLIFAAATVVAVHCSATGATTDADGVSSVAIWAYPTGDQLHVGVEQPAGHGATTLRIVVTQAGATLATWNDVRLAPGQTWQAPALTVTGIGPAQVLALRGGTVVASLAHQ
jgi:Amino acid permease